MAVSRCLLLLSLLSVVYLLEAEPSVKHCKSATEGVDWDCTQRLLQSVPYDVFSEHAYIKLGDNPYVCDCSMVWFMREADTKKKIIKDLDDMKCAQPRRLTGRIIASLTEKEVCPIELVNRSLCGEFGGLNVLDCSRARLNHIPFDVFDAFDSKGKIYLMGSYVCDCNMVWFIRRLKEKKFRQRVEDIDYIRCSSPANLQSKRFSHITEQQMCAQKDPDYCSSEPPPCNKTTSTCRNIKERGSYVCDDIDECAETKFTCQRGEECVNKKHGYKCLCKPGLVKATNGIGCIDFKACSREKMVCPTNARCHKTAGFYRCICKHGYTWKGRHCLDIDECLLNSHDCDRNALCSNTAGGYKCHCKEEYEQFKAGRLCVLKKEEKKANSNMIVIVAPLICFFISVILVVFMYKRRKNKDEVSTSNKVAEETLLLLKQQQEHQQQQQTQKVFLMDNMVQYSPSAVSQWSDVVDYDDENEDFDVDEDDFDAPGH